MHQDIKITLVQCDLHWHNPTANLANIEELIAEIDGQTDLIVLPEMFTTGFTMEAAAVAEPMNLITFKWLKQQAVQTGAVVVGSYIVKEDNSFYNRLIWMQPDGQYLQYDKKHLFRMAGETAIFASGSEKIFPELKGWRFLPLICYDLRFPVWSRNNADNQYDCLLYVASWPHARVHAWNTLLQARAIENLSYVVGVNRAGTDAAGQYYSGASAAITPKGEIVQRSDDKEEVFTVTLSGKELTEFRQKFPAYLDADKFELL